MQCGFQTIFGDFENFYFLAIFGRLKFKILPKMTFLLKISTLRRHKIKKNEKFKNYQLSFLYLIKIYHQNKNWHIWFGRYPYLGRFMRKLVTFSLIWVFPDFLRYVSQANAHKIKSIKVRAIYDHIPERRKIGLKHM